MPKRSRTFWLARRGHDSAEYEDAFAADEVAGRFAVADGATEGCFTGLWARLLVEDFVSSRGEAAAEWPDFLPALQERWDADVRARNLPWYADQGVRQGAFATFLGLVLAATSDGLLRVAGRRRRRHLPAAHPRGRTASGISHWSGRTIRQLSEARGVAYVCRRHPRKTEPMDRRPWAIRRLALDDDRRPGPVVPDRNRGRAESLEQSGISSDAARR